MSLQNASIQVTEFIINGFDKTEKPLVVGVVILITYILALFGNMINIVFIINDKRLHKPMYFLICNLAVVDILYTSSASPTMIRVLVARVNTISYLHCYIEMFAFHLGGIMEMFALAVMAFDRLIAIGCPFKYHIYLTNVRIVALTHFLWLAAGAFASFLPATLLPLTHCRSKLKYTFCEYAALMRTTCVDLNPYFNQVTIIVFSLLFSSFSFICLSYILIIFFVKLSTDSNKKKLGSTCVTHLVVVTCYYCPVFILVVLTRLGVVLTLEVRHGLTIGAILGPSLVNPFVYCLRTKEIRCKIFRIFKNSYNSQ